MKQNSKIIISFLIIILVFSFAIITPVRAVDNAIIKGLKDTVVSAPDLNPGTLDLPVAIGKIIQLFLSFLGILAVILILYAGYMWMTAGGDSAKTKTARDYIKNAVIGLVIILASYIITSFVIERVTTTLNSSTTSATVE